ncbi:MAG: recombinase family protein, partial [Planctomycetes bacterium]|nr:recombinase family protein [Planctomycetota bacterium]MCG2682899.1 recombinase family protein [Planctomycetales bacterium]
MAKSNCNGKTKAVGYCRTSGEGQRDNTSIPRQREEIERFCALAGWSLTDHYIDEAKSGSKIAGRDGFQRMMRDAANGRFQAVVVLDVTRFARDGFDIISSARTLRRDFGVDVVDTKGQFDTRDHRKTLTNFIHAGVSEDERLRIMDRMIGGRIARARKGLPWSSSRPVGREFDAERGCWQVTEKGHAIADMLQRYVQGESLRVLCREHNIPDPSRVSAWVHNGQLAGTYHATFHSPEIGVDLRVPVPGVPEVVLPALLEKVKARLNHNRTFNRHDATNSYPLSGFVHCTECGRALTGQARDTTRYYRHPKTDCAVKHVRADGIEPAAFDYLFGNFLDEPAFDMAVRAAMPPAGERKRLEREQAEAEKGLRRNQREIDRLVDAVAKGADVGLLLGKQDSLKSEREALARRSEELQTTIATLPDPTQAARATALTRIFLVEQLKGRDWRKLPLEDVRRFLFSLFGETTVGSGTGIFVGRDGKGRLTATFRGRVEFPHTIADGRAVSEAMVKEADRLNTRITEEFRRAVDKAGKPYTAIPIAHFPAKIGPQFFQRPLQTLHGRAVRAGNRRFGRLDRKVQKRGIH